MKKKKRKERKIKQLVSPNEDNRKCTNQCEENLRVEFGNRMIKSCFQSITKELSVLYCAVTLR